MDFFDRMKNNIMTKTTNGALCYSTTGNYLVDINFGVSKFRNMLNNKESLWEMFYPALMQNPRYALKWLLYLRDIRYGIGERDAFRDLLYHLIVNTKVDSYFIKTCNIQEYGRYDDLIDIYFRLYDNKKLSKTKRINSIKDIIINIIKEQLNLDLNNGKNNLSVSLLAKWMPTESTSSLKNRRRAKILMNKLKYSPKKYRKILTLLRKKIDIVEAKMSSNNWDKIIYENVPSKANLLYSRAFINHDSERRLKYIEDLSNNKTKINSKALFLHEIVSKYKKEYERNEVLESMWKNIPKPDNFSDTLVVRDGSGSMCQRLPNSTSTILDVANALTIYCSENNKTFKNKFITFSQRAEIVDLTSYTNLYEKLKKLDGYYDYSNTDIANVFNLILKTAIKEKLSKEDLPKNILIISDMQFDAVNKYDIDSLFEIINKKYKKAGYEMPKLIFWNVNSYYDNTIPMKNNKNGLILLSGYSTSLMQMVCSTELDPFKALKEILNNKRYSIINTITNKKIKEYLQS